MTNTKKKPGPKRKVNSPLPKELIEQAQTALHDIGCKQVDRTEDYYNLRKEYEEKSIEYSNKHIALEKINDFAALNGSVPEAVIHKIFVKMRVKL